jgi:enoyl-CoA hydratase/carnithine racemase
METPTTTLVVEEHHDAVALLRLDVPERRNALSDELLTELVLRLRALDADEDTRCVVLAGSDKVFAAGADVRALLRRRALETIQGDRAQLWDALRGRHTPLVAAVSGYCLGGGCELAMHADIIVASRTAKFGLPETQLGLIPGGGGTQLLPRAIGRPKALDMILSGRLLTGEEAEQAGLVSRVTEEDEWLDVALEVAQQVAERPAPGQRLAREALIAGLDMPLSAALEHERKAFALAFGTDDAREGMTAFIEKRKPSWTHR